MEKLIEELKTKIEVMNKTNSGMYNLTDEFLDSLYSVYPFNKFEYIISHLIGTLQNSGSMEHEILQNKLKQLI